MQPTIARFKCTVPACGKLFHRKEHMTRHLRSHSSHLQYECHICGGRYARSDVLKRHVQHHSQSSSIKRTLVACTTCQERKLRCDDSTPCQSCIHSSSYCSRIGHGQVSSRSMSLDTGNETWSQVTSGDDQGLANGIGSIGKPGAGFPTNDLENSWLQPIQEACSLPPFSDAGINQSFPNDFNPSSLAPWALDSAQPPSVGCSFTTFLPGNVSLFSPSIDVPTERLTSVSRVDVDHRDPTMSSLASESPASARLYEDTQVRDLHRYLNKDLPATKRHIEVYFAEIHPYWPILHAPTFDLDHVSPVLLGPVLLLASWFKGEPDHTKLAPLIFDATSAAALAVSHTTTDVDTQPMSLQTLQALLLCVIYATYYPNATGMLARALVFNSILASNCRYLGIFNGQHDTFCSHYDGQFAVWLVQEQLNRLAFSVLRVDAYMSVLMDHPPSVRYQEISIPLPKSNHLWTANSEDERRRLQWNEPAGREKALFCFLMRDVLEFNQRKHLPYHLTEADYHLGLCSLQVGTWQTAREAFCCCESDDPITNTPTEDPVRLWRTQLNIWRATMENDCQTKQNYSSQSSTYLLNDGADCIFSLLSLMLWHVSALTIHAPLKLLRGQGCCFKCRPSSITITPKIKTRFGAWIASSQPRTALWHAAVISRIVYHNSHSSKFAHKLLLDPLAIPGLFKSAIVACSYAYHNLACHDCTGHNSLNDISVIDLFTVKDDDALLVDWMEHGKGLATLGPNQIPVCQCKVTVLATWFRGILARSPEMETKFLSFLSGLWT